MGLKCKFADKRLGFRTSDAPCSDMPGVVKAEATGNIDRSNPRNMKEGRVSDFIWAIRLAKVHKGLLMTDWSIDPYTHRATFSLGESEEVDVGAVVKDQGLDDFKVIDDDKLGEAVVLDAEHWAES